MGSFKAGTINKYHAEFYKAGGVDVMFATITACVTVSLARNITIFQAACGDLE